MTSSIGELIDYARQDYGLELLDIELILAEVFNTSRVKIKISHEQIVSDDLLQKCSCMLKQRSQGMPLAYILGYKDFWTLRLKVTGAVLIPRPDTEILVETALELLAVDQVLEVLDLGTGSGAIALALAVERPLSRITAVDLSSAALAVAQDNAEHLGIKNVVFQYSDWFSNVPGSFDLIVANPPYVALDTNVLEPNVAKYEPALALYASNQGLAAIEKIVSEIATHLRADGYFLVEHGYDQALAVCELLLQAGFTEVATINDLAGHARVSLGRKKPLILKISQNLVVDEL